MEEVKQGGVPQKERSRDQIIIRTSITGIIANVFLAGFKAFVGAASHSIAVVMDAVNNLSDALSSLITIIGTKLAGRAPDKKHPLGHGRTEYLSAAIISIIVLYAGVTAFVESVKKIITPETPDYSALSLIIIAVAVVVKILLGLYVKKTGEKVNSDSLINSGKDALLDAIIALTTLISAGIYIIWHVSTEPYLGAIISIIIIKSGIEMISDAISTILGERVDSDLAKDIKRVVCENPEVHGAYDLILHNYGPDRLVGSIHVEVDDTLRADRIDELTRDISRRVYERFGVVMAAVGIYSKNTKDDLAHEALEFTESVIEKFPDVLQIHGFYLSQEKHTINFDMVMDFSSEDPQKTYMEIFERVHERFPEYTLYIAMDADVSD